MKCILYVKSTYTALTGLFFGALTFLVGCNKPAPAPLPRANFYVDNNGCSAECTLYFYDQSENAVRYFWDFGNGINSTTKDDSINYVDAGTYEVWFSVWNADNVKDSVRKTVVINE